MVVEHAVLFYHLLKLFRHFDYAVLATLTRSLTLILTRSFGKSFSDHLAETCRHAPEHGASTFSFLCLACFLVLFSLR